MGLPTKILAIGLLVLLGIVFADAFLFDPHRSIAYDGYHREPPAIWHGGYHPGYRAYPDYRRGYVRAAYRHGRDRYSTEEHHSRERRRSGESHHSSEEHHRDSTESHESREHDKRHGDEAEDNTRYHFMVGPNFGPYEYIDHDDVHKGFHLDLLQAVCAEAKKTCNWLMDRYVNCWDNGNPGVGLLAGWYDACVGVYPTPERLNSFNFSTAFSSNFHMTLHYKKGGSAEGHALDLTGRKVGFVRGWSISPSCLARQSSLRGNQDGDYTAVYYGSEAAMMKAIQDEEIDVIIGMPQYIPPSLGLMSVGPSFYCTNDGTAVMARYSKQPLLDWWNEAFERMKRNGDWRRLCEKAQREHGHRGVIHCVE